MAFMLGLSIGLFVGLCIGIFCVLQATARDIKNGFVNSDHKTYKVTKLDQ